MTSRALVVFGMLAALGLAAGAGFSGCGGSGTRPDGGSPADADPDGPGGDGPAGDGPATDPGEDAIVGPPPTIENLRDSVSGPRYEKDLNFVAAERPPGSKHWQTVQDLCFDRLTELGYEVERHNYGPGINVIGRLIGDTAPDEQVVLSAHYDSVPGCPGADDNATGVAGLLESARALAAARYNRTLVVACWDQEELGLIGSNAWAQEASDNDENILFAVSFETFGYTSDEPNSQEIPAGLDLLFPKEAARVEKNERRGDFIAVIADTRAEEPVEIFEQHAAELELPAVALVVNSEIASTPALSDLQRSDHASFWFRGYGGIMLTDTANFRNEAYHCQGGKDTVDRLDHDFAVKVVKAMVATAAEVLGPTAAR